MSDTALVGTLSDMLLSEVKDLIGRTIVKVAAEEHSLTLWLDDGSSLSVQGHNSAPRGDACSMRPLFVELYRSGVRP